jgi:hypothetical protein
LQEEVGKQLVPALSTVLGAILPVLRGFNGLSDNVKGPIVWIGILGASILVLGPRVLSIVANMKLLRVNSLLAAGGLEAEAVAAETAGVASAIMGFRSQCARATANASDQATASDGRRQT